MTVRVVRQRASGRDGTVLVALADTGIPSGRASVDVRGTSLFVWGVAVDEHHRGRGVGTTLMAAVEQFAADHGVAAVELEVEQSNVDARRLYERLGYSIDEERPCCDSGAPGWVMRKHLD